MTYYMGIDPGAKGGMALLNETKLIDVVCFNRVSSYDLAKKVGDWSLCFDPVCYLELVHSMPQQGVASTFTFGKNYGIIIGMLISFNLPYRDVTPSVWQPKVGFKKPIGNNKNAHKKGLKELAQRMFGNFPLTPGEWTEAADAILIAEYARKINQK